MKRTMTLVSLTVIAVTLLLWNIKAQATIVTKWSSGDPLAVQCKNFGSNGYCNNGNSLFLSTCPKTGTLPYAGLGATCTKYVAPATGDYAYFGYQMTEYYAETWVQNKSGQFGGYFWIQAAQGDAVGDSCGNAPGYNYYGIPYSYCLNTNMSGYYWITFSAGEYNTPEDIEDWATNMLTPPEGTG